MTPKLPLIANLLIAVLLAAPIEIQAQQASYNSILQEIEALQTAIPKFAKAKDWDGYLQAHAKILAIHRQSHDYEKGIKLGEKLLQQITRRANRFKASSWPVYQALASLYEAAGNTNRAFALHLKQLTLLSSYPESADPWHRVKTYNQLGSYYLSRQQASTAIVLILKNQNHGFSIS